MQNTCFRLRSHRDEDTDFENVYFPINESYEFENEDSDGEFYGELGSLNKWKYFDGENIISFNEFRKIDYEEES